jgi:hypothetical protein
MSERMSAEIWIGGKIPASLVPKLCAAISAEGVSLDWGDAQFNPSSADDLHNALRKNATGVALLWLCDHASRWGEFSDLEMLLQQHEIPYTRRCEGNDAYDPETVEYRPGHKAIAYPANTSGEPVVEVSKLLPVSKALAVAVESTNGKSAADRWALVKKAYETLRAELPPDLPPLRPFQIAAVGRRKRRTR